MTVPGVEESLRLPLAGLRSLVVLGRKTRGEVRELDPSRDRRARLPGQLEDGREAPGVSCLVWQPPGSETASPLRPGVSGKIIYKEPAPQAPEDGQRQPGAGGSRSPRPAQQQPGGMGGMALQFAQALAETPSTPSAEERRSLFLRNGDVIPSVITRIDEKGVGSDRRSPPARSCPTTRSRPSSWRRERRHRGEARQGQERAAAHPPPDAEGQTRPRT